MPLIQQDMHTEGKAFISLLNNAPEPFSPDAPLTKDQIKKIAPAISETYRALAKIEGWSMPETDKEFEDLSPFYQESNRDAAKWMLKLLAYAGLTLVDGKATEEEEEAAKQHLEYYLMVLAEAEHERWMEWYTKQGWTYNEKREDEKCLHNCLLSFSKLNDNDKDKDVNSIRHYPNFARTAGMKIIFKP